MRIAYCSDLHLGFGDLDCDWPDADVLVLAGDILDGPYQDHYNYFFNKISTNYLNVLYVVGNHEYYGTDFNTYLDHLRMKLSKWPNIRILENESVTIRPLDDSGDIKFIGATLWTDLTDPLNSVIAQRGMSDYQHIKLGQKLLSPMDTTDKHLESLSFLIEELDTDEKVVIITHHSPCDLSIPQRYKGDILSCAYYTDLSGLILDNDQIELWIHGHIHDPVDYYVGNTKVISNPRGYYGIETVSKFTIKVVEC